MGTEAEKRLAFADAYRMLNNRISAFINLPIASLDRLEPQEPGSTPSASSESDSIHVHL